MKKLLIGLTLLTSMSSYATSYWYDYCDASVAAYEKMRTYYPSIDIAPEKTCRRLGYLNPKESACNQKLSNLRFFGARAYFDVEIQTENAGLFNYLVTYNFNCNSPTVYKVNKNQ